MNNKKTFRKYAVTTMAAATATAAVVPAAVSADTQDKSFPDVSDTNSHKDAIYQLVEEGAIQGFEDGTFRPHADVTRSHVAVMLFEKLDLKAPEDLSAALKDYKDVDATHRYAEQIAAASEAGVFFGNSQGYFKPYDEITRQQMATVLVQGFGLDQYDNGEDVDIELNTVSDSHKASVQILANLGVTNQVGDEPDNNFSGYDHLQRDQFSSFLVLASNITAAKIIELESPADITVDKGSKVELPETVKATYDNDTTKDVDVNWNTDDLDENKVGEYTVTGTVEGTDATVEVNVIVRAIDVTVEDVSAINAEEIQVTFSDDVDEDSAKKVGNYTVTTNDADNTVKDNIKVDGKTVTLQLTDTLEDGDRTVVQTSNGIISKDGKKVEKFASDQITVSAKAPSLESVKAGDSNNVELTFDRPVGTTTGLVKIDNESVADTGSLTRKSDKPGEYTYTLDTNNEKFVKPGKHEIVIYDVENTQTTNPATANVLSGNYSVSDESVAPEVEGIEALNANKFFIHTSEKVNLTDAKLKVSKGNHTFSTGAITEENKVVTEVGTHPDNDNQNGIFVVVTDGSEDSANPLYKKGEDSVNLDVSLENYKDDKGNGLIGDKSEQTVTLKKNDSKPSIKSTELDGNDLKVTFNENISDVDAANQVVVRDKDGVIVELDDSAVTTTGDTVTINVTDAKDQPYTVEFKEGTFQYKEVSGGNAKDYLVNTRKNDNIKTTVESGDKSTYKYEVIAGSAIPDNSEVKDGNNVIDINYGADKEMTASAIDVSNYKLDGKALPAGSSVDFVGGKNKVRITLPENTVPKTTSYNLSVSTDVTTADGVHIVDSLQNKGEANKTIELKDNTAPELSSAKYALAQDGDKKTDEIVLTFDEEVQTPANDDFKVEIGGSEQDLTGTAAVSSDDDAKVVLQLKEEVNVSQTATITITDSNGAVKTSDKANTVNLAKVGSSVKANTTKVGKETGQ